MFFSRHVVECLRSGRSVDPETFETATISFSKLFGFSEFATISSPQQVVELLNKSHSLFDAMLAQFDAYKVETINDSYVVWTCKNSF